MKKRKHRHDEAQRTEQPEGVEIGHGAGLLQHAAVEHSCRPRRRRPKAVPVLGKIISELHLPGASAGRRKVLGEAKLVELCATR